MFSGFEDVQKFNQDNLDVAKKSLDAASKGFQAIATEYADFSKKSIEEGSAAVEKMFAAKSFDKAVEVQSDYAKTAYEGMVGEMTKIGEMYAELARDVYKPYEGMFAKKASK